MKCSLACKDNERSLARKEIRDRQRHHDILDEMVRKIVIVVITQLSSCSDRKFRRVCMPKKLQLFILIVQQSVSWQVRCLVKPCKKNAGTGEKTERWKHR